jgi:hypothetical protein
LSLSRRLLRNTYDRHFTMHILWLKKFTLEIIIQYFQL